MAKKHKIYVRYSFPLEDVPTLRVLFWEITQRKSYDGFGTPGEGNTARYESGTWQCYDASGRRTGTVWTAHEAAFVETEEVPPPAVRRGVKTRWRGGIWEKYSERKGWIPA